jgi:hypothetical protein
MVDDLKVPQQATLLVLETMWYVLIAFNAQVDEEINGLLERFKALEAKGDVPDSAEL